MIYDYRIEKEEDIREKLDAFESYCKKNGLGRGTLRIDWDGRSVAVDELEDFIGIIGRVGAPDPSWSSKGLISSSVHYLDFIAIVRQIFRTWSLRRLESLGVHICFTGVEAADDGIQVLGRDA